MGITVLTRQSGAARLFPLPLAGGLTIAGLHGILLFLSLQSTCTANTLARQDAPAPQTDAIQRLSRVFGFSKVPGKVVRRSPPQYMTELYESITDSGGLTKHQSPYDADVVRSFPDKDSFHQMHFHYNVSHLEDHENILEAEFHIFKLKPKPSQVAEPPPPHVVEIRIYQVLDLQNMYSKNGLTLLDAKRISGYAHGWHVFRVKKAVEKWVNGSEPNYGFLVTTTSIKGEHVNGSYVRFAQRHQHHDSKQPILVVFTDDGRMRHPRYISPDDENYLEIKQDILRRERMKQFRNKDFRTAIRLLNERDRASMHKSRLFKKLGFGVPHRSKRDANSAKFGRRRKRTFEYRYRQRNRRYCSRQEMFVDFDEIGWSGWIISPNGYNAYHCTGECPFPLGQSQKPTNHATVQSIVHALRVGKDVGTPCCVPDKLYSISLLYFDDDENVILKQYDDMVAASCGCH